MTTIFLGEYERIVVRPISDTNYYWNWPLIAKALNWSNDKMPFITEAQKINLNCLERRRHAVLLFKFHKISFYDSTFYLMIFPSHNGSIQHCLFSENWMLTSKISLYLVHWSELRSQDTWPNFSIFLRLYTSTVPHFRCLFVPTCREIYWGFIPGSSTIQVQISLNIVLFIVISFHTMNTPILLPVLLLFIYNETVLC